ncbi:MAG: hypothetical protein ACUVXE_10110 [Anaerolineae bacterium]
MRLRGFWPLLGIICGLLSPKIVRAQLEGPALTIQGSPDTTSTPPEIRTYASVIDPSTAETISGLTVEAFRLREAGTDIGEINGEYRPVGLAIVVVVDRGGISAPGDPRLRQATDQVQELVARLTVSGRTTPGPSPLIPLFPPLSLPSRLLQWRGAHSPLGPERPPLPAPLLPQPRPRFVQPLLRFQEGD